MQSLQYIYCKRLRLRVFNKSKKSNVGWVSDSVTQHLQAVVGLRYSNPTYIDFPHL